MDNNVYWNTGASGRGAEMTLAGATLQEWRKRGHDLHSVIADPLFVAPDKCDFRLRRNSPALQLGFKPIDLTEVGVRRKFRAQGHDTDTHSIDSY